MSQQAQETVALERDFIETLLEHSIYATDHIRLREALDASAAPVSPDSDLLKEAVGHIARLCDWIEHEVGAELPYAEGEDDARAFLSKVAARAAHTGEG